MTLVPEILGEVDRGHAASAELALEAAPVDRTWKVFTGMAWWPLTDKHIGKADAKEAVLEPRVGGRWLERGVDGSECDWGRVLLWEPPKRLVLAWQISPEWKFDPAIESEVEILFMPDGTGTRVDLEHRKLETYGARGRDGGDLHLARWLERHPWRLCEGGNVISSWRVGRIS